MNSLGLSILFTMGCACGKETIQVNEKKYTVKTRLGEGGFSVVDLVQDYETKRFYAMKRISCHSQEDERVAMQEAEYYNLFDHPNLIRCLDSYLFAKPEFSRSLNNEVRLLLPYYKRGTLQDELVIRGKTDNFISEERVLRLFRQLCEGIKAIHSAQPFPLVHRDLKPANVVLAEDDTPIWMDFGSMGKARIEIRKNADAQSLQDLASEKCSMPYKAPELFSVESHCSIDERVDIWSLGCCLYAMCYFKSPFDSAYEKGDSIALAVMSGNIYFPENTCYSGALHGLIRSMLEVNTLQRPFIDGVIMQLDAVQEALQHQV